ncbi:MAG TPA: hypothetical protein VGN06_04825 [Gaiellaceae bacterium]|jgi:hypothetical protein
MRLLVVFLGTVVALLGAMAAFNWWVDPFGDVYKPAALTDALDAKPPCLISQELVGARYLSFKLDVFHRRPTTRIVVGSSRVLKIQSHPGESSFSNLGFPGTSPETLLTLFRALPAKPAQTVYLGVEAFWFNKQYVVPAYRPSALDLAQYLLSRATFQFAFRFVRQKHFILTDRWQRIAAGKRCVIGRFSPGIAWNVDGSREFSWEIDPAVFPKPAPPAYTTDLTSLRSGYYAGWTSLDARRLRILGDVLALARSRGWRVVGFAPPEPPQYFRLLRAQPGVAARWHEFLRTMPRLFASDGFTWAGLWDGRALGCSGSDFPDQFHTDQACSARLRARLDAAAAR